MPPPPFPIGVGSVIHQVGQQRVILTTPCHLPGEAPRSGQCDFSALTHLFPCSLSLSLDHQPQESEDISVILIIVPQSPKEPSTELSFHDKCMINANPKVALTQWIEFHLAVKFADGGGNRAVSAQNPLLLGRVNVKAEVPGQDHNDREM